MTKKEVIEAIMWAYGCTRKQAEEWYKGYGEERKKLIVDGYKQNAKKSFLTD